MRQLEWRNYSLRDSESEFELQSSNIVQNNTQADPTDLGTSEVATTDNETTTQFDSVAAETVDISNANTDMMSHGSVDNYSDIIRFMERPRVLNSLTWAVGTPFSTAAIYPWYQYFNAGTVKRKLDNFMFFRGKMHLRFIINGSPFHYGDMRVSYRPMTKSEDGYYITSTTHQRMTYSQRPGFDIRPQDCSTYEMTLPFFNYKDLLNLTSADDLQSMGQLRLDEFVALEVANAAAANDITITVFGWFSDVTLTGATNALSLQSKDVFQKGKDEYGQGCVSGPATTIAKYATVASSVPYIGPYAKATAQGASLVAGIAKLFGYTDVPVISDTMPYKNMPFSHMASAHASEPIEKMHLDPKGELCLDSRTVGLNGEDEMAIANIVTKESLLTIFSWNVSDSPNTNKFLLPISPNMVAGVSGTNQTSITFTPMGHVNEMFENWRGDIDVHIKIICSKFHRGRLLVSWDPIANLSSVTPTDMMNVAYQRVIDLGVDTEVTMTIPYMQAQKYLKCYKASDVLSLPSAQSWQTSTFTSYATESVVPTYYNGYLTIKVLNQLSAPISTSDVSVMVYVKGKENLQFQNPRTLSERYSMYTVQSEDRLANTSTLDDNADCVVFGETFTSLRPLLRRAVFTDNISWAGAPAQNTLYSIKQTFKRVPPTPGFVHTNSRLTPTQAKGITATTTNFYYNFANWTPVTWMRPCFIGERGSIKHYFSRYTDRWLTSNYVAIERSLDTVVSGNGITTTALAPTTPGSLQQLVMKTQRAGIESVLPFQIDTQGGISFEAPNVSNFNMHLIAPKANYVGQTADSSVNESFEISALDSNSTITGQENTGSYILRHYTSAGTDYNLFFYLNAPALYLTSLGPTGVTPV